jgi:hypothetical protein
MLAAILNIRRKQLIYKRKVGRLATAFALQSFVYAKKIFSRTLPGPQKGPSHEWISPNISGRTRIEGSGSLGVITCEATGIIQ